MLTAFNYIIFVKIRTKEVDTFRSKYQQQEAKWLKADRKSNLTAFHSSIDLF